MGCIDADALKRKAQTIEPKQRVGKWLCVTDGHYEYFKCNQCGKHSNEPKPSCRCCGVKMEEGDTL